MTLETCYIIASPVALRRHEVATVPGAPLPLAFPVQGSLQHVQEDVISIKDAVPGDVIQPPRDSFTHLQHSISVSLLLYLLGSIQRELLRHVSLNNPNVGFRREMRLVCVPNSNGLDSSEW